MSRILSRSSTTMRSADLGPTPLIFFSERISAERIAWQNDGIFRLLRMFSAVFAPIPFTVQSSRKIFSSRCVAKPYRLMSSSRTMSTVCRTASFPGGGSLS